MSRHASAALASFMRTAELGSFAAAAKALGVSPAAVGQNVKRMEEDYGVKLFNRTTRKMSLTPEGVLLFQRAREPLRELDALDSLMDESKGIVSGPLRLTAPKHFACHTLMPLIVEFCDEHPGVEVDLDSSDIVRDFVDDPIDVAFRIGKPADSTMIARSLSRLFVFTFASPSYVQRHGEPTHPQDLETHRCIDYVFPGSQSRWTWVFDVDGERQHVEPKASFSFNDPEAVLAAGIAGCGLFQMDGYYARQPVVEGLIVPVMGKYAVDSHRLYMCYPSRKHIPLRVRAFIDFVLTRIAKDSFAMTEWLDD
ncbi:MAG: LysR family transcriptional regulator [Myxococcota bacterium]